MKCRKAQQWLSLAGEERLPAAVQRHLERCPACRRFRELAERSARAVRLLRYERPDPVRFGLLRSRILAAVQRPGAERIAAPFSWPALSAVRAAAVLLGISILLPRVKPGSTAVTVRREIPSGQEVAEELQPLPRETNEIRRPVRPGIVPVSLKSYYP